MRCALVLAMAAGCRYDEPVIGDAAPPHPDAQIDAMKDCPASYSILGQTARYRFTTAMGDYQAVAADCASDGGHLVKIEDTVEDALIDSAFISAGIPSSAFVWIGLSDPTMTDTYVWYDGTPLGSYNGFPTGHIPNDTDGMHNCVDKRGDGVWAIYFCTFQEKGFCECN